MHVAGRINGYSDVDVIDAELALADLAVTEKALDRAAKGMKSGDKEAARRHALYERVRAALDAGTPARVVWRKRSAATCGNAAVDREAGHVCGRMKPH